MLLDNELTAPDACLVGVGNRYKVQMSHTSSSTLMFNTSVCRPSKRKKVSAGAGAFVGAIVAAASALGLRPHRELKLVSIFVHPCCLFGALRVRLSSHVLCVLT